VTRKVALGRDFHLLFSAAAVSTLGDGVALTALPLLAARLTRDPLPVSLVSSAGHLPWLLFGLLSGAMVDRYDRRRLMWGTDAFRAVLVGALALGVAFDRMGIWTLTVLAFVLGCAGTLFDGAAQAMIPAVVPNDNEPLQRANGRLYGAQLIGQEFVGPAAGGALFAAAAAVPFALDAGSFVVSALLIAGIRGRFRAVPTGSGSGAAPGRRPSIWRDIGEGVGWLWRHRLLRTLAVLVALINLSGNAGYAVLVLLATGPLHLDSAGYGLLVAVAAVGGVAGTLSAARIASRFGVAVTLRWSTALLAASDLGVAFTPNAWTCAASLAIRSFAGFLFNVAGVPLRQVLVPDSLRGRVISAFRVLGFGAVPVGSVVGGVLASAFGLRAPFFFGAGLLAVTSVVLWRALTEARIEAARRAVAPAAAPAPVAADTPVADTPKT
jgi:MFS family permease